MSYPEITIEELDSRGAVSIQTGPFGTQLKASDYVTDGVQVINVRNIGYGNLRPEKLEFVPEMTAERLHVHRLEPNDIVFGRKGAVDRHLFVSADQRGWVQGSDCIRLRLNPKHIEPRFASYSFLRSYHKEWMLLHCGSKATMASLNQDIIRRIVLPFPKLEKQREVVRILNAYDELIENNRRRIVLLEEAARLLYREWFVHLQFPGHEHVKIVDGLPKGWTSTTASSVMNVLSGGTPKTGNPAYWDGEIGFFTPKDATDNPFVFETEKTITEAGLKSCNSKLYASDTVFITARGTVGKLNLAMVPMAMNQSCYALTSKAHVGQRCLFLALKAGVEEFRSRATGAVFDAIVVATFDRIPFVLPPKRLTELLAMHIDPMFDQIANLVQQDKRLAEARDILLPRLMNGEIAV